MPGLHNIFPYIAAAAVVILVAANTVSYAPRLTFTFVMLAVSGRFAYGRGWFCEPDEHYCTLANTRLNQQTSISSSFVVHTENMCAQPINEPVTQSLPDLPTPSQTDNQIAFDENALANLPNLATQRQIDVQIASDENTLANLLVGLLQSPVSARTPSSPRRSARLAQKRSLS